MYIKLLFAVVLCFASSCTTNKPTHNKYGGYIEACGDLPPLVGDDC